MHLRRLSLAHFRNYAELQMDLSPGPVLLLGENAQGKTNLLEAIFLLAAGRSERAEVDADYIAWDVRGEPQPFARVAGTACGAGGGEVSVELTFVGRAGRSAAEGGRALAASRRLKLNGVAKRTADVVGAITAVLFTTDDMELVQGPPAGRRRYLDVMLSQAERAYARALSGYNKVVTQRNALLKRIQEGAARPDELSYWDEQLADDGAVIVAARAAAATRLAEAARASHARLSGEREDFVLAYQPRSDERRSPAASRTSPSMDLPSDSGELSTLLRARLEGGRARDIAAGITLTGPHRDDLSMTLGGQPASAFASRGQQRTAALSMRLAEARFLHETAGERPLLLLDDVLSELDAMRRDSVLSALDADQVWITSPDADRFDTAFRAAAQVYRVVSGTAELMVEDR